MIAGTIAGQISSQIAADPNAIACTTEVIPFEQLYQQASRADIVVTSTGAQGHIFSRANGQQFMDRRRHKPMFFIDIAVPRDVDPGVNEIEGCFVYDIDDLQQVAAAHLADRSRESAAAEKIVSAEVEKYNEHLQIRETVPAIVALQQNAEALRQAELARAAKRLGPLTPEQQAAIDALTKSLTAKLLHPQILDLRKKSE
jgi:glutamyl-tRNA reductase